MDEQVIYLGSGGVERWVVESAGRRCHIECECEDEALELLFDLQVLNPGLVLHASRIMVQS